MNETHLVIFNRGTEAVAGDWIHIVPKGELRNAAADIVQVLDEKALDSILANIEADRKRLGDRWPGIYAGKEHFIYNAEQDSAAFAWFKDFEKRSDGIWAKSDGLTDLGRESVQNRRHKYTSFVADRRDTEHLGGKRYRIMKIDTVGFTNQANGKELLTPITNRNDLRQSTGAPADNQHKTKGQMKTVCTRLGLSADASEDAVLAAVEKLMNRAEITAPELLTLRNRATELETKVTKLEKDQQESDWNRISNRFKPEEHETAKKQLLANREGFLFAAERLPVIGSNAAGQQQGRMVINRGEGKAPGAGADPAVEQDAQQLAAKAEAEVQQYIITNRCNYETARNMVRLQKPELFGISRN